MFNKRKPDRKLKIRFGLISPGVDGRRILK